MQCYIGTAGIAQKLAQTFGIEGKTGESQAAKERVEKMRKARRFIHQEGIKYSLAVNPGEDRPERTTFLRLLTPFSDRLYPVDAKQMYVSWDAGSKLCSGPYIGLPLQPGVHGDQVRGPQCPRDGCAGRLQGPSAAHCRRPQGPHGPAGCQGRPRQ